MFKCIKIRVYLVSFSTYSYLLFLSKYFLFSFRQTGIQFHRRNIFTRTPSFPIVSGGFIFSTDGCLAVLIPRHKGWTTNLFQFFLSLTILVALVLSQSRLVTRNTMISETLLGDIDWNRFSFSLAVLVVFLSVRVIPTEIALPVSDGGEEKFRKMVNANKRTWKQQVREREDKRGTGPATGRPRSSFLRRRRRGTTQTTSRQVNM